MRHIVSEEVRQGHVMSAGRKQFKHLQSQFAHHVLNVQTNSSDVGGQLRAAVALSVTACAEQ